MLTSRCARSPRRGTRLLAAVTAPLLLAIVATLLPGCGEVGHNVPKVDPSPWRELGECRMELSDVGSAASANYGYSVSFADAEHGWLTVLDRTGGVWETSDGGKTWALSEGRILGDRGRGEFSLPASVGQVEWPDRIVCVEEETIWLVFKAPSDYDSHDFEGSQAGGVLVSRDGGRTWRRCLALDGEVGYESTGWSSFVDAEHGWLTVGYGDGEGKNDVYLLRTKDAGRSWQRNKCDIGRYEYESMTDSVLYQFASWVPSTEEGLVWEPTGGSGSALQPSWPGKELAFSGGGTQFEYDDPTGEVLCSTDGGKEWRMVLEAKNTYPLSSVYFADELSGWVGGDGLILATHDGGQGLDGSSWERELVLDEEDAVEFMHFCRAGDAVIAAGWATTNSVGDKLIVRFYRRELPKARGEADASSEPQ